MQIHGPPCSLHADQVVHRLQAKHPVLTPQLVLLSAKNLPQYTLPTSYLYMLPCSLSLGSFSQTSFTVGSLSQPGPHDSPFTALCPLGSQISHP